MDVKFRVGSKIFTHENMYKLTEIKRPWYERFDLLIPFAFIIIPVMLLIALIFVAGPVDNSAKLAEECKKANESEWTCRAVVEAERNRYRNEVNSFMTHFAIGLAAGSAASKR